MLAFQKYKTHTVTSNYYLIDPGARKFHLGYLHEESLPYPTPLQKKRGKKSRESRMLIQEDLAIQRNFTNSQHTMLHSGIVQFDVE